MKLVILAAGEGKRLRPLTNDVPKCMVKYQNKEIISQILDVANDKFEQIAVVGGYKFDILKDFLKHKDVKFYENADFAKTNMVYTLFCAREFLKGDIVISYADIVYSEKILQEVLKFSNKFGVVVDLAWRDLWKQRMNDPLSDAETLKIKDEKIVELGKKPLSYDEIQAQYMGLMKINGDFLPTIIKFYDSLDRYKTYDGNDFKNMYMTSFIQMIIDKFGCVEPIRVKGGWVEVDSVGDLDTKAINCTKN
ncbi:NTP transferase domain-containing protein [Campylobacter sputorum]|uniref:phosphocholine cytidylyltransferase family protein n=1 Tax=Campylobacter sputorum TaxID=206 RepID=UPI00053BE5D5|nr:phosphocholine cytidylyltransferase family protein [Campylobacter sputorum]